MENLGREHLGRPLQDLGWSLRFDGARRRLGLCLWKKGGRSVKTVSLSRHLAVREGWALMEDVARHEIAHGYFSDRGPVRPGGESGCRISYGAAVVKRDVQGAG